MKKGLINIHIITTNNMFGAMFRSNHGFNFYRAASYIKLARQSGHVLLLNNGTFLTGSKASHYYATLKEYKRLPLITMMNRLKYDASNISIHDFSLGSMYFNRAHAMSDFPFLSCNVLNERTKEPYFNTPYIIHEYKGVKIAVIAVSEAIQVNSEFVTVADKLQSLKTWVRYMYDLESPDYCIALHNGELSDVCDGEQLCTEGIHMLITNGEAGYTHDVTEVIASPPEATLLHMKLSFKERTNSFELVGKSYELVDLLRYQEDIILQEAMYYEEKEIEQNI
ncbi:hypothetical protein [Macrococcoides caseolyticum]|uniref:hypothetical protein n=1 Tax=Macrococcoides caseolyticum TaxID=69966 RepID=UPI001F226EA2|nr:hypothetical protein [Macrococcus caseolyticus]MCE4955700.1 bifunctional metallophosphatase/5'-nucleotidase [Macrococcus caseolyticus]